MSEDDDWTPPSEAEMKVLTAKRERSDKISKLMGDYLLKVSISKAYPLLLKLKHIVVGVQDAGHLMPPVYVH